MNTSPRPLGILALLLATSAWGSLFFVGKSLLARFDPMAFTLIRYSIAALLYAALIAGRGAAPWQKLRLHAKRLAGLGALGFGLFSVLVFVGLAHSTPSHGAVIMATMPITTQMLRWLLDGVRPARSALWTALLALSGVAIVSGLLFGGGAEAPSTWAGDLTALVGTLGWVFYTRGSATLPELDVLEYSALTAIASWPVLLVAAVAGAELGWVDVPSASDLAASWRWLFYVGLVPSVIAVLAYNFGVRTLGSITGTAFLNMVPVSALAIGVALGHWPSAAELLGTALVIVALLIHTRAQAAPSRSAAPRPAGALSAARR